MSKASEKATPGFLVWRLSMKWRTAVDRAVAPLGLTHAQYSLLASLYGMRRAGESPSQRRLADHTGLEALYVSKLARSLESAGLLDRARDPRDPRAVRLTLTERGRSTVRQAIGVVHDLLDRLLAPLGGLDGAGTAEFRHTLVTLLDVPLDPPGSDAPSTNGARSGGGTPSGGQPPEGKPSAGEPSTNDEPASGSGARPGTSAPDTGAARDPGTPRPGRPGRPSRTDRTTEEQP